MDEILKLVDALVVHCSIAACTDNRRAIYDRVKEIQSKLQQLDQDMRDDALDAKVEADRRD